MLDEKDLPGDVARRMCACGGVRGLARDLPSEKALRASAALHLALSDTKRLRILHLLAKGPLCVCVLRDVLKISDSKLSYHLAILKGEGLIRGKKSGNWITYTITPEGFQAIGGGRRETQAPKGSGRAHPRRD